MSEPQIRASHSAITAGSRWAICPVRVAMICLRYAQYGIIPLPIPPLLMDVPSPTDKIPVQSSSDLVYLKAIAEEAGYVFYLEPGPAPGTGNCRSAVRVASVTRRIAPTPLSST